MAMADPPDETRLEDVVDAYRWILGREPESREVVEGAAARHPSRARLRAAFLLSPEFQTRFRHQFLALGDPTRWLDPHEPRLVFLHVPKTGGTTLHHLLAEAVGADRVALERHNRLYSYALGDIASAKLFSGHYDRRTLDLLWWSRLRVATLLREPRARLISVYRYLRAHSDALAGSGDLALAKAARRHGLGDFLRAALEINRASVDNTYLRAFGASLPLRRWEQRAEPGSAPPLQELGGGIDDLRRRAARFLEGCAAVGVLDRFDLSLKAIFDAFGLIAPRDYEIRYRLEDIVAASKAFEPVDPVRPSAAEEALIEDLTRYDRELYLLAARLLLERTSARREPSL